MFHTPIAAHGFDRAAAPNRGRPLRVMIDGMNLSLEQGTGVATYARNLGVCVKRLGHELTALYGKPVPSAGDPILREAMFVDEVKPRRSAARWTLDFLRAFASLRPAVVPRTGHVIRARRRSELAGCDRLLNWPHLFHTASARFALTGRFVEIVPPEPVDIAHWTYPLPIRVRGARNVYTFHDLVPLKLPYATLDRKARYWRLVERIARSADHILTVSDCSRRDILEMLPVEPERVTNTYQSVGIPSDLLAKSEADLEVELAHAFHAAFGDAAQAGSVDGLKPQSFYLYVGAIEPKKNLKRIIEGFLASGVPEPLVVVGRQAWSCEEEVKMMLRSPRIVYLDYLPFSQVVTLMRTARALLFVSLYEGFGLPVLEAFLCGTPVVTARASATQEIAAGAALLADPYDPREIRDAIRTLSASDSGPLRADLAARGRRRAGDFDEARIAARLDLCYRETMAAPPVRARRSRRASPAAALSSEPAIRPS